jgi:hypothetical protein
MHVREFIFKSVCSVNSQRNRIVEVQLGRQRKLVKYFDITVVLIYIYIYIYKLSLCLQFQFRLVQYYNLESIISHRNLFCSSA